MSNLTKLLTKSGALVRQGDLAGARAQLEKAVRDHGRRAEPWISLSAVHGMGSNYSEALRCACKAVELAPNHLQGWVNLANAAQSCGELAQSADALRHARGLQGCPPDITLNLGLILSELREWSEAEEVLREYCSHQPPHREATLTLSKLLARKDDFQAATAFAAAYCHRHPQDIPVLVQLGRLYLQSGQVEDAWRVCNQVAETSPDHADLLFFKAALLMFDGRYEDARNIYERLLQRQQTTRSLQLLILAANACRQTGNPDASVAYAREAVRLHPQNIAALTTLSNALVNEDLTEARKLMEEAAAIAPHDSTVIALKGRVLELEGDKEGAWKSVRAAIEAGALDSDTAYVAARVAPTIGNTDEVIDLLERLADRPGNSVAERRGLHFTLTQLCDKDKQYDRAFEHAAIANRLKNARYDHNPHKVDYDRLTAVYSQTEIDSLPRSRNHSELPIFIVGMPRSGTSLLEQILSCHSQVHARGETTDIGTLAETIPYYPDGVRDLTQDRLDEIANAYIQRLRKMSPSANRFTDKMPGNYMFAGIISQVFPEARIINCRRDPRDVCLSHFMIEFSRGFTYAYNLESLAQVYQQYQKLMEHWKSVLPMAILDVRYEELVADPQTCIGKVLNFCDLEWEDACLDFHKSKRQVMTASYDQVRNPLYSSSVARWKNYEQHLEPVSRILGLQGNTYP